MSIVSFRKPYLNSAQLSSTEGTEWMKSYIVYSPVPSKFIQAQKLILACVQDMIVPNLGWNTD
jgi:hypothetical protein